MNVNVKQAMFSLIDELDMFPETLMITVQRKDLETVVKHLFQGGEEWSNQAAYGYAIVAAKRIGMRDEDIQALTLTMSQEFDTRTLESAAEIYRKSNY